MSCDQRQEANVRRWVTDWHFIMEPHERQQCHWYSNVDVRWIVTCWCHGKRPDNMDSFISFQLNIYLFIYLFIYKLKLAASYELYTTHKKRVMKLKSIGSRSTSSRVSRRQHSTSETNWEPKRNARFGPHQTLPSASCVTWHPASAKVRQYRNGSRKWCCIESSGNPPVTALLPIDTSVPWTSPTWWYWSDLVLLQHR